jgi:hypothetical protein
MPTIRLITAGCMPRELDLNAIISWKTSVFKIADKIENFEFRLNSDLPDWGFSDSNLRKLISNSTSADFTLLLVNIPLEGNYYSRRITQNFIVGTFYEIKHHLLFSNIPLHNMVLRALYAYALLFIEAGNRIPAQSENYNFTHHETRGCLYDMTGNKEEVVESCSDPIICAECQERLRSKLVSNDIIHNAQQELKKIGKGLYYRVIDFVKKYPLFSLFLSSTFALILGTLSSILGSLIYRAMQHKFNL